MPCLSTFLPVVLDIRLAHLTPNKDYMLCMPKYFVLKHFEHFDLGCACMPKYFILKHNGSTRTKHFDLLCLCILVSESISQYI